MKRKEMFAVLCLFVARASEASVPSCGAGIQNYRDLISCAEKRSPEVQSAQIEVELFQQKVGAAGQWRNPEFAAEVVQGNPGSGTSRESDLTLAVPIELGGKISARTDLAQSELFLAQAKLYEVQAGVRKEAILKLHRLRQVLHEQELIDESVVVFSKLVSQYARRPGLAPEQKMSMSVFQLSKGEYELKRSEVSDELLELDSYFRLTLDMSADEVRKNLPEGLKVWPEMKSKEVNLLSPQMKIFQADLQAAQAALEVAKSDAWPTLMVGPSLRLQTDAGQSSNMFGVNLSFSLPVFNQNGAAKSTAATGVKLSETKREIGMRQQDLKRDQLLKSYDQSVKALKISISHEDIEKRHSEAEQLIQKGVAPSALVIEAHRTSYELERTRHQRELRALELLADFYILDGTILEANL